LVWWAATDLAGTDHAAEIKVTCKRKITVSSTNTVSAKKFACKNSREIDQCHAKFDTRKTVPKMAMCLKLPLLGLGDFCVFKVILSRLAFLATDGYTQVIDSDAFFH
jgi:hypothetical protein